MFQLETERLLLRPLIKGDAAQLALIANDFEVSKTTLSMPHPYGIDNAFAWIEKTNNAREKRTAFEFGIELKSEKVIIGCIGFINYLKRHRRSEVGYFIGRNYWSKGYCSEALKRLLQFGFKDLDLHKITAQHMAINAASGKVMLKAGMKKEGILKEQFYRLGQYHDSICYGILK